MSEDMLIRLENLRRLRDEQGMGPSELSKSFPNNKPTANYFSALLGGHRSFGEKIARKIEARLNLPRGWLDQAHVPGVDEPLPAGPSKWARLAGQKIDEFPTEEERRKAYALFVQIVEFNKRPPAEEAKPAPEDAKPEQAPRPSAPDAATPNGKPPEVPKKSRG